MGGGNVTRTSNIQVEKHLFKVTPHRVREVGGFLKHIKNFVINVPAFRTYLVMVSTFNFISLYSLKYSICSKAKKRK